MTDRRKKERRDWGSNPGRLEVLVIRTSSTNHYTISPLVVFAAEEKYESINSLLDALQLNNMYSQIRVNKLLLQPALKIPGHEHGSKVYLPLHC